MSIQRYEAYVVKDCPSGCWEAEHREGHYVKYDDHIAIVDKKDFVIRSMQTRMDKLEKAMYQAVYNSKAIKAEGIRERFHAIKALMDGKGNDPFREGYLYALELFIEYADELEDKQ